jgi:hypothetical protein
MRNTTGIIHIGWEKSISIHSKIEGNKGSSRTVKRERLLYADLLLSPYSKFHTVDVVSEEKIEVSGQASERIIHYNTMSTYYQNRLREKFVFIPLGAKIGIQQFGLFQVPLILKAEIGFLPSIVFLDGKQLKTGGFINLSIAYHFNLFKLK